MKKLILLLALVCLVCLFAQNSSAQAVQIGAQMRASAATTGTGIATPTTYYHQLTWTVSGSVTACSVTLDTSADNLSWSSGGAIPAQTCTSGGSSALINVAANYVRINLGTFTGSGSIYISYAGYSNGSSGQGTGFNPAIPGPIGGTTPSTGAFTSVTDTGLSPSSSVCTDGSKVLTTSGCAGGAPDPSLFSIVEDFGQAGFGSNPFYGSQNWTTETIGSAPALLGLAGVYPNLGILQIATNAAATAGQGGAVNLQGFNSTSAGLLDSPSTHTGWTVQWIFKIEQTANTRFRVGISTSPNAVNPHTGVFLRYDTNVTYGDTNFMFAQSLASAETQVDSGIPVDTNWHRIKITSSVAGTAVYTLYDAAGNQQATGSLTITGVLSVSPAVIIGTNATAQTKCDVDYMSFFVSGLAR